MAQIATKTGNAVLDQLCEEIDTLSTIKAQVKPLADEDKRLASDIKKVMLALGERQIQTPNGTVATISIVAGSFRPDVDLARSLLDDVTFNRIFSQSADSERLIVKGYTK